MVRIKFWGVRGSISTPENDKLKVGGNTSCVEMNFDDKTLIFDAGTGIRNLGKKMVPMILSGQLKDIYLIFSHFHWDHIQGFPFFAPVYFKNINLHLYGPYKPNKSVRDILAYQMEFDYFPVKFEHLAANFIFHNLDENTIEIFEGLKLTSKRHIHPGIAYGYRMEYKDKIIVYSTDTEHFQNDVDKRVVDLAMNADVFIHDSQYKNSEMSSKLGWGHSPWEKTIEVAQKANVKKVVLFHHDPERTDEEAFEIEKEAKKIFPNAILATEQTEIILD